MAAKIRVEKSDTFRSWLLGLRDRRASARIQSRIDRLEQGNPGDIKSLGGGLSELRINHGPGYRVYLLQRGDVLAVLLCGGDKSTQDQDIARAREMAKEWRHDG
ncbi:MAG: type II toxin-antitoxin system RelE/ParE family toxin [Nocardioides sp.]